MPGALPKLSWSLYDLANTIFSMNVISLYFPLWIASSFAGGEVWYPVAYSASMLVVGVVSPMAGVAGDALGHKKFLLVATIVAVGFTFFLGLGRGLSSILLIFALANIGYQLSLVFYNSLLPSVSLPAERGRISGLGVALGYLGSFLGMTIAMPFIDAGKREQLTGFVRTVVDTLSVVPVVAEVPMRQNAFVPTAILFGLFALPLFIFVRERKAENQAARGNVWNEVVATARAIYRRPDLRYFYLASFLYMDAVHTVYIVMATYAKFAIGLPDGKIVLVMSIAIGAAIAGSFVYGLLTDRLSTRTTLLIMLVNWVIALVMAIVARTLGQFLAVAMVAGIGLGAVEVVTRVALLRLIDETERGRYFGFFNLTGKASSVVGPQLWALSLMMFTPLGPLRYRIAVAVMLVLVLASVPLLLRVRFEGGSKGHAKSAE